MKVLVTGATGFVGQHLVPALLGAGIEVVAVARNSARLSCMGWPKDVQQVACDIHTNDVGTVLACQPDVLIHLAWPGLPNYEQSFHFEQNLPADGRFLKAMALSGVKHIMVTGTGAEYGLQSGALAEDAVTQPYTAYGIAKDALRRYLQFLQRTLGFTLQWVRLFHMYGVGQSSTSLLAQLDAAIEQGAKTFDMSGGEQRRDYLPVTEVARRLVLLATHPECTGVINCCSGSPMSVRHLVDTHLKARGAAIALNLGVFPYPAYESMAYWGRSTILDELLAKNGTPMKGLGAGEP